MASIPTEITKDEFLKACNNNLDLKRKLEEEERLRLLEEERRRREEEEFLRLLEEERKNWDEWYSKLPNGCKNGFVFMDFKYKIDPRIRKITREYVGEEDKIYKDGIKPINNDDLRQFDYVRFTDGSINKELGI